MLRAFFWIDAAVLVLALAAFCYNAEAALPGGFAWDTRRWVTAELSQGAWAAVDSAIYHFETPAGELAEVALGGFLRLVLTAFQGLLGLEGLFLATQLLFGSRGARRLLRPIQHLALTAQRLSEAQRVGAGRGFDEQKFHNLEDAIQALAPNQPDARLATGDSDLQGLEAAINGLLKRMHESYQQQSRFVSDASHELRTPIAVIQGYAAMLDRWGKNDENVLDESIAAIKS
ncbi:MAG: HAMP domain-containing histidine kinase, partial [Clostridiales bacterium]|nr:HAMP domain-containing histidine kinase [Clostridiales bacterium]